MSGIGGGQRDLTAVLIGACVGSMTVLVFTIGILAFIYWCCFRERIRWWRKFENAAVVLGNPGATLQTRSGSIKKAPPGIIDSSTLAGISTIPVQFSNPNSIRSYTNGQVHRVVDPNGEFGSSLDRRNSLIISKLNQNLASAMKSNGLRLSNAELAKRSSLLNVANERHYANSRAIKAAAAVANGKVRPGVSLAALPTSATAAHFHQQNGHNIHRRTSHKVQLGTGGVMAQRVRGVSVPTDPSDDGDQPPTNSSASSFAQSAKRWSSMPAITALGDIMNRERVVRTASKRNNDEEISSSWRAHNNQQSQQHSSSGNSSNSRGARKKVVMEQDQRAAAATEKQRASMMMMMTREAHYTFTADDDGDDGAGTCDKNDRSNKQIDSPPPSVSAIVGVLPKKKPLPVSGSGGEYGSHSSSTQFSGDDSAIVVMDSGQSTSSKNGTDVEQSSTPPGSSSSNDPSKQPAAVLMVTKPALKKPTAPPVPVVVAREQEEELQISLGDDDEAGPESVGKKALDADGSASSMRTKIAKIRRYKQRSKTTGAGLNGNGINSQRSLSVTELNRNKTTANDQGGDGESQGEQAVLVSSTTARLSQRQSKSAITGHSIGIHVDNLATGRPSGGGGGGSSNSQASPKMRRYATLEALSDRGGGDPSVGSYVGRVANQVSVVSNCVVSTGNGVDGSGSRHARGTVVNTGSPRSTPTDHSVEMLLSSVSSASSASHAQPRPSKVGARLSVGNGHVVPSSNVVTHHRKQQPVANGRPNVVVVPTAPTASLTTPPSNAFFGPSATISTTAAVLTASSGSYNIEQAARQHHQQQQLLTNSSRSASTNNHHHQQQTPRQPHFIDEEDVDDVASFSADQAKRVTENAFQFLNEFSETETQSQRSIDIETNSRPDSEHSFRPVQIPSLTPKFTINPPPIRTQRGSPAPPVQGRQFRQHELRLGDWL